ncbi:MFS transporter [Streptomyces pluripotens]|uniref:MFS transporter n=1 Tax=Streptomyces pluripotens TaxID=1355015 RepID=A0A221P8K1_9ACTN|nr:MULTISPECIES: MFS transporter [Streptomyces]ASN28599.1 MFS transporter [Streptomyces pluripotens]MCH0560741.1 MFS transporter [Streptomyces sp. MUM 16J]
MTLIASSMCIFVVQLDFLALNLALPRMASDLGTTTTDLQWVISGYMLALAATLIPGGRLGDILGRRRMLITGLVVFALCSLGAGLASTPSAVIVMRIAQGAGAGVLFPLAIAVITDAYPPERTMRVIGDAYGMGALALALGPVFGGGVTELLSWRVVLFVNVPIGAAAIVMVVLGVRESRDTTVPRSIDLPGLCMVTLGIAAVTITVDRLRAWPAGVTVGVAVTGLLLLAGFVVRERVARWPLVALDLFHNKPYVVITFMSTVANISFVLAMYGVTIYLQQVAGHTPLGAGMIFLAASVAAGVAAPLSGRLGERFDVPRTMVVMTLVGAVGLFLVSLNGDLWSYLPGLALTGFGYGMGWTMGSSGTQAVVPPERVGQASGVELAIVIGIAGMCVAAGATLIEVRTTSDGLAAAIGDVLLWVAIGSAVAAAALGLVAARVMPEERP